MSRSASLSSASLTMTTMRAHSRGKSLMHSMLSMGADGIEQAFSSSIGGSFSNGPDIGNIDLLSDRGSVGSDIGDSLAPALLRSPTGAVSSSWLSPSLARDQWNGVAPAAASVSFARSLRSPSMVAASLAPK
jgi:hypothetical protein